MSETKEYKKYVFKRDKDLDIETNARFLGDGLFSSRDMLKHTRVEIFETQGGSYIVTVVQWTEEFEGNVRSEINRAYVAGTPKELMQKLIEDNKNKKLGEASRAAWEEALNDKTFRAKAIVHVN